MTQNDVGDATGRNAEHLHAQEDLIHGNSDENHGLWTRDPRSVQADTAASLLVPLFVGSSAAGQGFQRGVRASSRLQAPVTFVDQRISQAPGPRDGLPRRMPPPI